MRISDWSSDVCSSDRIFTQRQAERDRVCLLPTKPDVVVAKADCTARLLCQVADEAVVQIDEQQCVLAAPGHQNSVSISEGRSEEHTYEPQSLMRNTHAVVCLKKKNKH